jgi:Fe-S-cluster-containing dehydrogenase component
VSAKSHTNDVGQKIIIKDKSHKCNACTLNEREVPACVNTCPSKALLFGNRHQMIKIAQERVKAIKKDFPNASIYGLNEFGGLRVITVLKDKPAKYGLQENVKVIEMSKVEAVKDIYGLLSMFTFGVPALKRTAYKMAKTMASKDA